MRPFFRLALLVFLAALAARLTAQPANVQADPTTGVLFRPSAATFISGNGLATATGGIVLGANGGTGVANTGKTLTLGGNVTTSGAFGLTLTLTAATGVTLPTTGTLATLAGSETLTNKTLTSPTLTTPALGAATATSLTLSGNISSTAWTTNGVRLKGVAATLTDTTSTGTVAAAYTDVLGGNTIAASNATTFTDYITAYFREPTAGSLVTMTNKWALGGESLRIGTSTPMSVSTAGAITANSLTGRASTDLTLTGGSTGASLVLGQGTTAGAATLTATGTGTVVVATAAATRTALDISNTSTGPTKNGLRILGANATSVDSRQWSLVANDFAYGDLSIRQSSAAATDPLSGTSALYVSAARNLLIGGTTDSGARQVNTIADSSTTFAANFTQVGLSLVNTNTTANNWLNIQYSDDGTTPSGIFGHQITDHTNNYGLFRFAVRGSAGFVSPLIISPETTASSTTTGALQVTGGVGVTGPGYFGGIISSTGVTTAAVGAIGVTSADPALRLKATGSVIADQNTYEIRSLGLASNTYLQFRTINDANSVFTTRMVLWQDGGLYLGTSPGTFGSPGAGGLDLTGNLIVRGTAATFAGAVTLSAGTATATNAAATQGIFKGWNSRSGANADNGQIDVGGATGLRLMSDASGTGGSVVDDRWDNAASSLAFRLRGNGTPVTSLTLTSASATFAAVVIKKNYTVATLPAAASYTYGEAYVSDATQAAGTSLGSAPTGGGSVKRGVYSDGSSWLLR